MAKQLSWAKLANLVLTLVVMVLLGLGMHWGYQQWQTLRSHPVAPDLSAAKPLWAARLHGADGKTYALKQYMGKPLVVNFWATWCDPCREEMPEISDLAQHYPQISVIGLAVDEASAVHAFSQSDPVSYPLLIAENEGMLLAEALGNHKGVLPFTVILSPQGAITHTFFGRVNREMLLKALNLK